MSAQRRPKGARSREERLPELEVMSYSSFGRGVGVDEARDVARCQSGSPARLRESAHEAWAFGGFDDSRRFTGKSTA